MNIVVNVSEKEKGFLSFMWGAKVIIVILMTETKTHLLHPPHALRYVGEAHAKAWWRRHGVVPPSGAR